jgi:pimeloyl-ACP methyl ester carboxylesterase
VTASTTVPAPDKFVTVDGLNIRYIERGEGPVAIFMHGGSIGSSADVFQRNLGPLAAAGIRAIAYDHPGYGLSDNPTDWSVPYRRDLLPQFIDALGLGKIALVPHSQSGGMAAQLALKEPDRYSHLIAIGTGGLLPPLEEAKEGRDAAVQGRVDRMATEQEPTLESARKQLESTTFHTELVTDAEVALRLARSVGKNFEAHITRTSTRGGGGGQVKPIWQRLVNIEIPFVFLIGRQDRAKSLERAELLQQHYPTLDIRIVDDCKHMVPWDAADEIEQVVISMLKGDEHAAAAE